MRFNKKLVGAALVVATIAFSGAASTASNTVAAGTGRLGYSNTTVTGGEVVSITYNVDTANVPPLMTEVIIDVVDLVPEAAVRVRLDASTNWDSCTSGAAGAGNGTDPSTVYTCTLTGDNAAVTAEDLANTFILIGA